jgi:hypothetical protein
MRKATSVSIGVAAVLLVALGVRATADGVKGGGDRPSPPANGNAPRITVITPVKTIQVGSGSGEFDKEIVAGPRTCADNPAGHCPKGQFNFSSDTGGGSFTYDFAAGMTAVTDSEIPPADLGAEDTDAGTANFVPIAE